VVQKHAHATTMHQAVIAAQPPTAHSLHAAKTAATPAHHRAIMVPKRAVMAISGARLSGLVNLKPAK
jgi:hypothetical protein